MRSFWDEQFRVESSGEGLVAAMPVMDASGLQIVVHLKPLSPGYWLISDHGEILSGLDDLGCNTDSGKTHESLESQCKLYGIERDGLILQKLLKIPFDPIEIQVFTEGLAAISHLRPKRRAEVTLNPFVRMEGRMIDYFEKRSWVPERRHKLNGQVEHEIVVDFYAQEQKPMAVQLVGRNRQLRSYMEQWGWRWTDLGAAHPELIKAMVFDPDNQEWDASSLKIGEKVCDVFTPYYEADEALDAALVA